jgi:dipeptidyl aminopeptidase/acylaminoacyl peptidase
MRISSLSRKLATSVFLVFLLSVGWLIHAASISPVTSAPSKLHRAASMTPTKVQDGSGFASPSSQASKSSSISDIEHSKLFQLTNGLHPGRGEPIPAAKDVDALPVFDVSFYNWRGKLLSGWLALNAPHAPVIILTHGTPGNRVSMIQRGAFLFKHGYNVLLFDFQSYGQSQGVMSTLGLVESEDILSAISYLKSLPDTSDSKIGVLGLSMGATSAVLAASRTNDITALVAESCPVDATQVPGDVPDEQAREADKELVEEVYGVDITQARPIDVVNKLAGHTAIFFVNGDSDEETPLAGMYALYQAAQQPKQYWVVSGAAHAQSFAVDTTDYIARVDAFFDENFAHRA